MTKIFETNKHYQSNLAYGSSTLKRIHLKSILHALESQYEENESMVRGGALHCTTLEPERFNLEYVMYPLGGPRRPSQKQIAAKNPSAETLSAIKFWKEFDLKHAGKSILTQADLDAVIGMKKALRNHKLANTILHGGEAEYSYYVTDPRTGLPLKCRPDYVKNGCLFDLKTTMDASPIGFARQVGNQAWHLQAAFYVDVYNMATGENVNEFYFIAVENKAPHAVMIHLADEILLAEGRKAYMKCLDQLKDFQDRGGDPKVPNSMNYFGYPMEVNTLTVPSHFLKSKFDVA